jgi:MFS family permease
MSHPSTAQASASRLGRDFWFFQIGQMISTVGDACGTIALTWWILDVTRSPGKVSTVLASAMFVQTTLTPVLGPLGDRFSRKWLILSSDLLRGVMMAALALLAFSGAFSVPGVLAVYIPFVVGSALFSSNHMSIVPQLVSAGALQNAVRMSESLQAVGRVMGGIVAGVLVTWVGVGSAFVVDAVSFGIAAMATAAILDHRGGAETTEPEGGSSQAPFLRQLRGGFQVIHRVPILFWLCVAIAFFNLVLNPMLVLLPTYAKLAKGLPAWFLGALESSMGAGIVIGAIAVGALERRLRRVSSVVIGLLLLGGGIALLPHLPGVIPPLGAMFCVGVGAAWTNIPISTRVSVAVPDHFRSRVNSIISFLFDGTAPIGVAAAGVLIATIGVTASMTSLGALVLLLVPVLFLIPDFTEFFRRSPAELTGHFLTAYPEAFTEDPNPEANAAARSQSRS